MRKQILIGMGLVLLAAAPAVAKEKVKTQPDLSAWMGLWVAGEEQQIAIAPGESGGLAIEGYASYGATDPERVAIGAVNVGEVVGEIPGGWIRDGEVAFAFPGDAFVPVGEAGQYDCTIEMVLRGDVLEVTDNFMCGGLNVTFTGTYRR